ncbi:MAG: ribonuclease III [Clostridia bacterium]|nr:ribonuclease III [Clostridia bacterium]
MSIGKNLLGLYDKIEYSFRDISYLENAMTHSSYANEGRARGMVYPSNERLEFLGDSVLEIIISEYLYDNFKNKSEGTLTKMRQYLVCEKTLSKIAFSISLGDYLNVGRGEELTDCRQRPKVLADALEALIAAIYLDSDRFAISGAKEAVLKLFNAEIENCPDMQKGDFKTLLQQLVEKDGASILEYRVVDQSGPEHEKTFTVEARVNNNVVGVGVASSKKDAEQTAAQKALLLFGVSV